MTLRKLLVITPILALTACDNQPQETITTPLPEQAQVQYEVPAQQASAFAADIGLKAYTSLSMATQGAQELDSSLQSFLYHPGQVTHKEVQQAWRNAYSAYLRTLLFSRLPIADPPDWHKQGIDYQQTLALLDSWPIEGGYIDHVPGYPFSGIVNDLTLELNEETLLAQHGFSDPTYASLGFHAFEFMLWGADGQRAPDDFFPQENTAPVVTATEGSMPPAGETVPAVTDSGDNTDAAGLATDVQNHNRRRQYIQLVSEQLQKHLHRLQRRWEPSNGYYANLVQRSEPMQVIAATLNATQKLLSDELLGKRMSADSSEFSHSSPEDIRALVQGLRDIWLPQTDTEDSENGEDGGSSASSDESTRESGIALLLAEPQKTTLLSAWQEKFAAMDQALDQWEAGQQSEQNRQQVREQLISLMPVLQRSAAALNIPLRTE